ncbi:MAG TPA: hypothetical protein VML19_32395 [Verrucomicrobiae bacterium]|nr:hypothetical protein [Verrucomicrobiae bacterium]
MAVQLSSLMSTYAANHTGAHPIISRNIPNRTGASNSGSGTSSTTTTLSSTNAAAPASSSAPAATTNSSSGFSSLFPVNAAATIPAPASPVDPVPTAQSVFGANPWITNPTGSGPTGTYSYNPYYFATPQTAAAVASMVGGKVVSMNAFSTAGSPFQQNQPNQMVQLPNGALINPGLVAEFYTHGYSQSMINQMIANEVSNVSEGN